MTPEHEELTSRNWLHQLRDRWDEFTGEIFDYIAQQEAKISREELDERLSKPRQ
jgi:hypothetical protein